MSGRLAARAARRWAVGIAALASASCLAASPSTASVRATQPHAATVQLGINTYLEDQCYPDSWWTEWATNQMAAFKSLGANSVALAISFYTDSPTSNAFFGELNCSGATFFTPTPAEVAIVVDIAHADGLQVLLRPLLDETNLHAAGTWRGQIAPTSPRTWFANYLTTMTPYLQMAQQHGVERFAISTELESMAHQPYWPQLLAKAHRLYTGQLVFTTLWGPQGEVRYPGTAAGIDAYQGVLGARVSFTVGQLLAGWDRALRTTNRIPYLSSTTIDEVGIDPQDGAYVTPYVFSYPFSTHPFNQMIQANWFSMACRFVRDHHMKGLYFWGPNIADNSGNLVTSPDPTILTAIQPAAQTAVKQCFGSTL